MVQILATCAARNEIFSLNWRCYVPKRDIWTIGEHLYFVYYPIIYYQWINMYRVERIDICRISLTRWRKWNMKMQPS